MAPSFDWWAKNTHKGTPVVVKMENPNNWSMVELEAPSEDDFLLHSGGGSTPKHQRPDKSRNKNAKQLTWVLFLKPPSSLPLSSNPSLLSRSRLHSLRAMLQISSPDLNFLLQISTSLRSRRCCWLGKYDTAKAAAYAYDREVASGRVDSASLSGIEVSVHIAPADLPRARPAGKFLMIFS